MRIEPKLTGVVNMGTLSFTSRILTEKLVGVDLTLAPLPAWSNAITVTYNY